jgi:hypothetical protein
MDKSPALAVFATQRRSQLLPLLDPSFCW